MSIKYQQPAQQLAYSEKNKQWRVDNVDYYCSQADEQYDTNWRRMYDNYRMHNNIIDQSEFQQYCDPMNLDVGQGKDYVQAFNQMHNKINVLLGEESRMPWKYSVIAINEEASNRVLRQKQRDLRDWVKFNIRKEVSFQQEKINLQLQQMQQQIPPEQAEEALKQLQEELAQEEAQVLDPGKIEKKYRTFLLSEETLMSVLHKQAVIRGNLRHKKNESYFNALVPGLECVRVAPINGIEEVEIWNPLGIAYHKSPEVQFIQDGDWVTYKQEMTMGDAIDIYGKDIKPKDFEKLNTFAGKIYGTDAKMYSRDGYSPSHWENLKYKAAHNDSFATSDVLQSGQYGQSTTSEDYVTVYTCYWKSQKKVGFLSYTDEYGEWQEDIVDEAFVVPKYAHKAKEIAEFSNTKTIYSWQDPDTEVFYSFEWDWKPETWEGTRIEDDIYVNIKPISWAYVSLENPKEHKLPVYGAAYNSKNAPIVSIFDRGVPWQKFYYVIMAKFMKLISLDKGKFHLLNTLFLSKDSGLDMGQTLAYLENSSLLPYNPAANADIITQLGNTMKVVESFDLSNTDKISYYVDILKFIEQQIATAMGVPPSREAKTTKSSNVTDNQQDLIQSAYITQPTLALHNLIWEDVLNAVVRLTKMRYVQGKSKTMRFLLDDDQIALLQVNPETIESLDFGVKIAENDKTREVLQIAQQHAQALIQNDKITLSTFISMLKSEDLVQLQAEVKKMEQSIAEQEQAVQQQQLQSQEAQQKREIDWREDNQAHLIELEAMKIEGQMQLETLKASLNQKIEEPDYEATATTLLELEQAQLELQSKIELEKEKLALQKEIEKDKLELEKQKIKSNEQIKDKELKQEDKIINKELQMMQLEAKLKEKETNSKIALEKVKARNKPKPSK